MGEQNHYEKDRSSDHAKYGTVVKSVACSNATDDRSGTIPPVSLPNFDMDHEKHKDQSVCNRQVRVDAGQPEGQECIDPDLDRGIESLESELEESGIIGDKKPITAIRDRFDSGRMYKGKIEEK